MTNEEMLEQLTKDVQNLGDRMSMLKDRIDKLEVRPMPRAVEILLDGVDEALEKLNTKDDERMISIENEIEDLRGEYEDHIHTVDCSRPS